MIDTMKIRGEIIIYGEKWRVRSNEERSPEAKLMIFPDVALARDFWDSFKILLYNNPMDDFLTTRI